MTPSTSAGPELELISTPYPASRIPHPDGVGFAFSPFQSSTSGLFYAMHALLLALMLLSGLSFVAYGVSCLLSAHMRAEFARFGLARFRVIVGVLELLGGSAQLAFWFFPTLGLWGSGGLALLMAMGVATRVRVGDRWRETAPAMAYLVLNAYLFLALLKG